jgi:hypothetical protein
MAVVGSKAFSVEGCENEGKRRTNLLLVEVKPLNG